MQIFVSVSRFIAAALFYSRQCSSARKHLCFMCNIYLYLTVYICPVYRDVKISHRDYKFKFKCKNTGYVFDMK